MNTKIQISSGFERIAAITILLGLSLGSSTFADSFYNIQAYNLQVGSGNSQTDKTLSVGTNNSLSYSSDSLAVGTANYGYFYNSGLFGSLNIVTNTTDSGTFGTFNYVDGTYQSIVVGTNNNVSDLTNGAVIGKGLSAGGQDGSLTIGRYNITGGTNMLFTIGNGNYSSESNSSSGDYFFHNALTIDQDGTMSLYGSESTTSTISINPNVPSITIDGAQVLTTGGAFNVNTSGQATIATAYGQSMLVGRQLGSGYSYPAGIFQAITDNGNGSANYYFQGITGGPSGTTNFSVRADGYGYFAGSVGIGTSNPAAWLDVNGKAIVRNNMKIFGASEGWAEGLTVIQASGWGGIRLTRNDPDTGNYTGNWAIGYNASTGNDFSISTFSNGAQYDGALHISNTTRNVGIGTTNPLNKLQVNLTATGGISLGTYNSTTAPGVIRFVGATGADGTWNGGNISGGDNGSSGMAIINTSAGSGNSQDVAFYTHLNGVQSSQKMLIKSDGTVLIAKRQGDIVMGEFGNPGSND